MTLTYRIYLAIRDGQADTSPALAALLLVSRDRITETINAMRRRGILYPLPGCVGRSVGLAVGGESSLPCS